MRDGKCNLPHCQAVSPGGEAYCEEHQENHHPRVHRARRRTESGGIIVWPVRSER